jgi:hypothetical protein
MRDRGLVNIFVVCRLFHALFLTGRVPGRLLLSTYLNGKRKAMGGRDVTARGQGHCRLGFS